MTSKNKIERICRDAGMLPVQRGNIYGSEVFVADGPSMPPHLPFRRFGIGPEQFPGGMYVTLWWVSKGDEKLDTGRPLFFELLHDPEYGPEGKQRARINAALLDAADYLESRRKAH